MNMKECQEIKQYTRIYARIDLDAVEWNMRAMQANLSDGARMIGVVKTDGYGHGAVPVAQTIGPYVAGYAVASIEEARNLQKHGIKKPILVLGATHPSHSRELVEYGIRPAVFTMEQARALSDAALESGDADSPNGPAEPDAAGVRKALIHLAVDTGMGRIGLPCDEAGVRLAVAISRLPGIYVEGIFTHFARADEADKTSALRQLEKFRHFVSMAEQEGLVIPIHHIANSAGIMELGCAHWDMVRAGISIYGLYPSDEVDRSIITLRPVMSLHSFVTYIKEIPAGMEISYGGTFRSDRPMKVATIPAGYGDGYPRNLSGRGSVLIRGRRAPILGRICMDQFMVDVSHIPDVCADDPVTLIGRDGQDCITVEELAGTGGGFHYEIVCDIGKRVPRVYVKGGQVVGTKDYFDDMYTDFVSGAR